MEVREPIELEMVGHRKIRSKLEVRIRIEAALRKQFLILPLENLILPIYKDPTLSPVYTRSEASTLIYQQPTFICAMLWMRFIWPVQNITKLV